MKWHEQARAFIQENAGKKGNYRQELLTQLGSIQSGIDFESKEIQDSLDEDVYYHYWDLAVTGALSQHPTVQTIYAQTNLRLDLCEKQYAIYCEQIQTLSKQLTHYLAGDQLTLADPKETLMEAFKVPAWGLQKYWQPKTLFSKGWLAEAQKLIPAQGSSEEYQAFLLRVANREDRKTSI